MQEIELIARLLKLDSDWHIASAEFDEPSNRVDITIYHGPLRKKKLWSRTDNENKQDTITLRHLPFAGMRSYLHVPRPNATESNKIWAFAGSAFTVEMEEFIVETLSSCHTIQAVAKLAHVTNAEAREVSERRGVALENYKSSISAAPAAAPIPLEHVATRSPEPKRAVNLPAETDAAWQKLIDGEIPIQSSSVALQMLIQRVRQNIQTNPSEVTRLASTKMLRRYFIKNQGQHQAEIKMLSGDITPTITPAQAATATSSGLPSENDLCWQQIINGSLKIDTSTVGLQMMIESVHLSIERNPSEASQKAGVKILHQFFTKHQSRLQAEIQQLGGSVIPISAATTNQASVVPATSAPIWQEIITGQKAMHTNTVGLQMMIESVHLSIERNPSEASQKAGVKILHQFFTKHQSRLQAEIQQLGDAVAQQLGDAVATPIEQTPSVPPHAHPGWQRLINGELEIKTDVVALKMMLERIRISIENNPSDTSRIVGAKILRQYFIKHQNKHQAELDQLLVA